jgi:exo-beta-1,3-glucanase (GH17 family)
MRYTLVLVGLFVTSLFLSCNKTVKQEVWANDILGNPEYQAISYGGYRTMTRDTVPTIEELKEDLSLLSALGIKILRTYNTQQFSQAADLIEAIDQIQQEDPDFEMYVMLGVWIDCLNAWTDNPDHSAEDEENNKAEIDAAVALAKKYPGIIKIIAVGNEAMVHWATSYYVQPGVILKWVNYLQDLKSQGELDSRLWITSSDNFASWGGGDQSYHNEDLKKLIEAVDYVSMHTYPFHETHYNPEFWGVPLEQENNTMLQQIDSSMDRAIEFGKMQYMNVAKYIADLGVDKQIHIGETGWSTKTNSFFGKDGSAAADEYKQKLFHDGIRDWTDSEGISCFFFEAFNEKWKDGSHPNGSENHFGLFTIDGQAKYLLWDEVDQGIFEGLSRNGNPILKTYGGNKDNLMKDVFSPPLSREMGMLSILTVNGQRNTTDRVTEEVYVILDPSKDPEKSIHMTYPSAPISLNPWEGTSSIELLDNQLIEVKTPDQGWWGCGLQIQANGFGEDLTAFANGRIHFDIKGETNATFQIGFQTGTFNEGDQTNNFILFGPEQKFKLTADWQSFSIPVEELNHNADLSDVTSLLYMRGDEGSDGGTINLRNIWYSKT